MSFASDFLSDSFAMRPLLRLQNGTIAQKFNGEEIANAGFGGVIFSGSTPDTPRVLALAHECRAAQLLVWADLSALAAPREELKKQQLVFDDLLPRFKNSGDELDTLHPQSASIAIEVLETFAGAITGVLFDGAHRTGSTPTPPFPWTDSLPAEFNKRYDSDLLSHLANLISSGEDAAIFRQHFWDTIHHAREENYLTPIRRWCNEHELQFCERNFRTEYHALAMDKTLRARLDSATVALENKSAFPIAYSETQNSFRELNRLLHAGVFSFERAHSIASNSAPEILRNEIIARHATCFAHSKPATKIGVLFPARSCQTHYHPQGHRFTRWVGDDLKNVTDLLNELHFDWLFVQEEQIIAAPQVGSTLRAGTQQHELEFIIVPSVTALCWAAWEKLEAFVESGGKVACLGLLPRWSERGRDRELEARISKTTRIVAADLYEAYAALENETELPPTIGFPIFREYHSGGRLCCYQPRLNTDADDARLRVRQILHESITPDFETLAPNIRYSHRFSNESSFFFVSNDGEQKQAVNARLYPQKKSAPIELNATNATQKPFYVFMPYSSDEGGGVGLQFDIAPAQSRLVALNPRTDYLQSLVRATFDVEDFDGKIATGMMTDNGTPRIALLRDGKIQWRENNPVIVPPPLLLDGDEWSETAFEDGWEYSQSQFIPTEWKNCNVFLEVASNAFSLQSFINNRVVSLKITPPFRFDISAFLSFGIENNLMLKVWWQNKSDEAYSDAPFARLVAYPHVEVKITP